MDDLAVCKDFLADDSRPVVEHRRIVCRFCRHQRRPLAKYEADGCHESADGWQWSQQRLEFIHFLLGDLEEALDCVLEDGRRLVHTLLALLLNLLSLQQEIADVVLNLQLQRNLLIYLLLLHF